jgi:hypothetical protein
MFSASSDVRVKELKCISLDGTHCLMLSLKAAGFLVEQVIEIVVPLFVGV